MVNPQTLGSFVKKGMSMLILLMLVPTFVNTSKLELNIESIRARAVLPCSMVYGAICRDNMF